MDENFSKKYIPISLNKDGSLKKSSSIATLEQLGMLKKYIDKTLKTIGNNLYSGEIPINPFEKGCEYCKYKGLCGYPEGTRRKRTKCKKKEWEIISEAVSENTGSEK
jgi:ATP-dependent helicase/nuclease subunit B